VAGHEVRAGLAGLAQHVQLQGVADLLAVGGTDVTANAARHRRLQAADHVSPLARDDPRQLERGRGQLGGRDEPQHAAVGVELGRVHGLAGEHGRAQSLVRQQAGGLHYAAGGPVVGLGQDERGARSREQDVAHARDEDTEAHAVAVDRADDRDRALRDREREIK
jgi:hypothetical protein